MNFDPKPLTDTDLMPFGKFKGTRMVHIPNWYLRSLEKLDWVEEQYPEVWDYIEDNWELIQKD